MSGFTCLQLLQPCFGWCCIETGPDLDFAEHSMSKAWSGKVKTYDLFSLPGLLKAESGCLSSNYMFVFGFFHFSRSSAHAGIQHKCILREYRLCTTHYIQRGIALILKKKSSNFQQQKYTHQMLPPQILMAKDQWFKQQHPRDTQQCNHYQETLNSFLQSKKDKAHHINQMCSFQLRHKFPLK